MNVEEDMSINICLCIYVKSVLRIGIDFLLQNYLNLIKNNFICIIIWKKKERRRLECLKFVHQILIIFILIILEMWGMLV